MTADRLSQVAAIAKAAAETMLREAGTFEPFGVGLPPGADTPRTYFTQPVDAALPQTEQIARIVELMRADALAVRVDATALAVPMVSSLTDDPATPEKEGGIAVQAEARGLDAVVSVTPWRKGFLGLSFSENASLLDHLLAGRVFG